MTPAPRTRPIWDRRLVLQALRDAFVKLDPRTLVRNPVMLVVEVGSVFTLFLFAHAAWTGAGEAPAGFILAVSLCLWFTVLFGNLAEALAEGRGKAQAATLRRARQEVPARRLHEPRRDAAVEEVRSAELRRGDLVLVEAGGTIPVDGDVVEGIASVDESAITGESAPVIRESGGDRSIVPRREWVPLEETIGSALSHLEARLGTREVTVDLPEDVPLLYVDPVLFEQVLVNLLENVVKHGGPDCPLAVSARRDGARLELAVADRGPGLPPGAELAVFEKFYRGPQVRTGGVGLGLSICRGILDAHRATITAENREGGGARFRILLPVEDPPRTVTPLDPPEGPLTRPRP